MKRVFLVCPFAVLSLCSLLGAAAPVAAQPTHGAPTCPAPQAVPTAPGFVLAFAEPNGNTGVLPRWTVHRGTCAGGEVVNYQGLGTPVRVLPGGVLIVRTLDRIQNGDSVLFVRVSPTGSDVFLASMVLSDAELSTASQHPLTFGRSGVTVTFGRGARRLIRYSATLPATR